MVASARSATPAVETTVPSPKVSWLTRSPASSETTARLPGDTVPGRAARTAPAGVEAGDDSARCHSTSDSGTSSRKRDGGLYDGDPHAERRTARERYRRLRARVMPT